jgi:beta-galactosidase/beta-glucuronidase
MRGVGGNAWRTSHNAPEIDLLELADRLGIVLMDENRVFATSTNCPGCPGVPSYQGDPVIDMSELVSRDRLHASVLWWSFCNEAGCGQGQTEPAYDFKVISYSEDGSHAVGANMGWLSPITPTNMSDVLDVMGFSHASYESIANFHELEPMKPLVMSECCSCETQRGEDSDMPHNSSVYFDNENSGCVAQQTQTSNAVTWMSGTFVWTLHDYYG